MFLFPPWQSCILVHHFTDTSLLSTVGQPAHGLGREPAEQPQHLLQPQVHLGDAAAVLGLQCCPILRPRSNELLQLLHAQQAWSRAVSGLGEETSPSRQGELCVKTLQSSIPSSCDELCRFMKCCHATERARDTKG